MTSVKGVAEVSSARSRLDATLQLMVDKKDEGHVSSEDEISQSELATSVSSPVVSPSKRAANRSARKRKRKEDFDYSDGQVHHQYIMKLFDRSVDLAQFDEDSPLYPICRSWLKNRPYDRDTMDKDKSSSPEHDSHSDEEIDGIPNVYKMPKPIKAEPDDTRDYRIPEPLPNTDAPLDINADADTAPPPEQLLLGHMSRWKEVRIRWREAGFQNESRFADSMNLIREIFENQMKEG
ncbi:LIN37 [Mytilus coruscus]|uniref:LIN37 n=1 Tax=Mytilus coruscus TaxID=42192 RepID=A0A6J8D613_MYTCO|nr:LIN37 [Mytilus coruscus]